MTTIKTTKALTLRNSDTGKLTSLFAGQIVSVDDALATQLISDGLAIVFSSIVPANTLDISKNGTYDVTNYAEAVVNVPSQECPAGGECNYDDKFDGVITAIYTCGAVLLVLYFFYCIYRLIIITTGGR